MQSLADIQYAMGGEPKAQIPEQEFIPKPVYMAKPKKDKGIVVFKLVKNNRSGGVYIPNIDYAIDQRTVTAEKPYGNGPEQIRLLRGVNTIWVKEQTGLDANYIKRNARYIEFPAGTRFMTVKVHDVTKLEFMRIAKHNIKNKNRTAGSKTEYFEYDPTEIAQERLERDQKRILAIVTANQVPFDKMQKHAFYLRIPLTNELGMPKNETQLRPDYLVAADRDFVNFLATLDSPIVETSFLIRTAIIDNKIDVNKKDGKIYWSNDAGLICTCPKSEDAVNVLVEFALSKTEEANEFLEKLKRTIT